MTIQKETRDPEAEVVVHLLNGEEIQGKLIRFSPYQENIELKSYNEKKGKTDFLDIINRKSIAYIKFKKIQDKSQYDKKDLINTENFKIHTIDGKVFRVKLNPINLKNTWGFKGLLEEKDSPFYQIYFFPHGVKRAEKAEPIGEILQKKGLINKKDLKYALQYQKKERSKRIGEILSEKTALNAQKVKEALTLQQKKRLRLGEILIEMGLINEDDLQLALDEQKKKKEKKVGELLVEMGKIDEETLMSSLSMKFHIPFIDLDEYELDENAFKLIPLDKLEKYQALPLGIEDNILIVAISDPLNLDAYNMIRFITKYKVQEVLVKPSQLKKYIEMIKKADQQEFDLIEKVEEVDFAQVEEDKDELEESIDVIKQEVDQPPIIRLANQIISEAIDMNASDIHLTPIRDGIEYALRIHGTIVKRKKFPKNIQRRLIPRFKLMAGMDIAEHRLPQDGRLRLRYANKEVELRGSCIPGINGEGLVFRILQKQSIASLNEIGLRDEDVEIIKALMERQFGFILVTGPTGSGKSTTLSSMLAQITNKGKNIISIEDPVEYEIPGVTHVQVNERIGLTFARILRNILRHDPDVIMIGEIRDRETALIGMESALTGHLVLSTLHTNRAVDTINRLKELGVSPFTISSALIMIINQMLCRSLCPYCKIEVDIKPQLKHLIDKFDIDIKEPLFNSEGCKRCNYTGVERRMLIYELMEITDTIRFAIYEGASIEKLQNIAIKEGMVPKRDIALEMLNKGFINQFEFLRALG